PEQYASFTWFEVYDLLEFVVENAGRMSGGRLRTPAGVPAINGILDEENAGYSFVGGQLTPITNPAEIAEIEATLAKSKVTGLAGVHAHIEQALTLFGKRPSADYRNAIKEAISGVES